MARVQRGAVKFDGLLPINGGMIVKWKEIGEGALIVIFALAFAAAWIGSGIAAIFARSW
jgi:hypothetical protein